MKFSGLQKYFLLLMLSFGIVQGSYACFSSIPVNSSSKSTHLYSNNSQSLQANCFFDLVEENIDEDSDNFHFSVDFIIPTNNNVTFQKLQNETVLFQRFLSSQPFHNQKINILNCSFLI
jgi:hypothetical protein